MRPFSRRAFLAGIGGTAVALPWLEHMTSGSTARAQETALPMRYLVSFAGASLGNELGDAFTPDTVGAGYDLKTSLVPLGTLGVQSEVSVVSGLKIPWDTGGGVPAGGRPVRYHQSTVGPLLSGVRSDSRSPVARGSTSDQIVADAIAGDTRFPSLELRIQAEAYGGNSTNTTMSYRRDGSGSIVPNPPIASPRIAFDSLFTGFTPSDLAEAERRRILLAEDQSILDLVKGNADRLRARLGAADQRRLERHFDEIRDLELRVSTIPPPARGACALPPDPGEDPPIALSASSRNADLDIGWADEDTRGRVLCDLIAMAFTCDLTRSVSLMMTCPQCYMNSRAFTGLNVDIHDIGHGGGTREQMALANAWHVKHFAYLIAKLRDTPELDGSVLDRTAAVLGFEGGLGYDPEGDTANSPHSSENMAVLIGGRAGGLRSGVHVVARDAHPASVLITAMNAVGVEGGLGEVSGAIDALLT